MARMEEERGVHRVLVGKPEGKRPLGRPRCRWEDNIKMDLQEVGGVCGDWMELAQDRERWRALVSASFLLPVKFRNQRMCKPLLTAPCNYRKGCKSTPFLPSCLPVGLISNVPFVFLLPGTQTFGFHYVKYRRRSPIKSV